MFKYRITFESEYCGLVEVGVKYTNDKQWFRNLVSELKNNIVEIRIDNVVVWNREENSIELLKEVA